MSSQRGVFRGVLLAAAACAQLVGCGGDDPLPVPPGVVVPVNADMGAVAVGSLPGSSSVRSDGSAAYQIPLWIPPGRNGMQPDLSLSYGSRAGNDLLGVGWSVAGFSRIQRCHRNVAIDGFAAPISLDGKDAFCLDGQRLRPVSGTEGLAQSVYKTERDSFAKITIDETRVGAPWKFTVFQKDGRILRYGGSDQAVRLANRNDDDHVPAAWLLAQVEDRYGNTVKYSYSRVGLGSYPEDIAYTGSLNNAALAPNRTVHFAYEEKDRPDIEYSAAVGRTELTRRLASIEVWGPDHEMKRSLLRKYAFEYRNDSITHRSLLKSVTAIAGGVAMSPTTFEWELGEEGFETINTGIKDYWDFSNNYFSGFRVFDLNQDGRADLLYLGKPAANRPSWWGNDPQYYARLSQGKGLGPAIPLGAPARRNTNGNYTPPLPMLLDAGGPPGVVLWATHSSGDPGKPNLPAAQQIVDIVVGGKRSPVLGPLNFFQPTIASYADVTPMDIDGDGLGDVVAGVKTAGSSAPRLDLYRNLGNYKFANGTPLTPVDPQKPIVGIGVAGQMRGVDIDGDGKQELIFCRPDSPATAGRAITDKESYETDLIHCDHALNTQRQPIFLDANGDGLDDAVLPTDPTKLDLGDQIRITAVLNNGRG